VDLLLLRFDLALSSEFQLRLFDDLVKSHNNVSTGFKMEQTKIRLNLEVHRKTDRNQ
jgi:hypothetical protein